MAILTPTGEARGESPLYVFENVDLTEDWTTPWFDHYGYGLTVEYERLVAANGTNNRTLNVEIRHGQESWDSTTVNASGTNSPKLTSTISAAGNVAFPITLVTKYTGLYTPLPAELATMKFVVASPLRFVWTAATDATAGSYNFMFRFWKF